MSWYPSDARWRSGDQQVGGQAGSSQPPATPIPLDPGYFLPQGWDKNWKAALAACDPRVSGGAAAPATVCILGASIEAGGANVSDAYTKAFWPIWRAQMLARGYPLYGDFFPPFYSQIWAPNNAAPNGHAIVFDYNTVANIVSLNVGPLMLTAFNVLNNGAGVLMHYAHPLLSLGYSNLSGDIVYFDPANGGGGTWVWNLNGTVQPTVTLTNSGTMKRISWNSSTPGWVNGVNVVNIKSQSANQVALIIGFGAYPGASGPGASGIGFGWMAQSAMALNELGRTDLSTAFYTGGVVDKIALLGGTLLTAPNFSDIGTPAAFGFPFNAKLMIHGWFDDELFNTRMPDIYGALSGGPASGGYANGTPAYQGFGCDPLTFRWHLNRMRHMNLANAGSMLYLLAGIPSGQYSDVHPTGGLVMNRHAYIDQYHATARHLTCGIMDDTTILSEKGFTTGDQTANNFHYTDIGHARRATRLAQIT